MRQSRNPFRAATVIDPIGPGRWSATVQPGWEIAGNSNGGYLMAITARAMAAATGRPDPVTVTAHFLSPGRSGPAEVDVQLLREGRRFATASATLASHRRDRVLLGMLGTFGDLSAADGPELVDGAPPDLPRPEDCVALQPTDWFPPPFVGRVDLRLHPDDGAFAAGGARSGKLLIRGWLRLPEAEEIDSLALLCLVDAFPPTIFNAELPIAWTPTIELTAHVRAVPVPGWLRCRFSSHFVSSGFLEEDGEMWDAAGRLVAQSRQLALVPKG